MSSRPEQCWDLVRTLMRAYGGSLTTATGGDAALAEHVGRISEDVHALVVALRTNAEGK